MTNMINKCNEIKVQIKQNLRYIFFKIIKKNVSKSASTISFQYLKFILSLSSNSVLLSKSELDIAEKLSTFISIGKHHDRTKIWDLLGFITTACKLANKTDLILDAGCGSKAIFANSLLEIGFTNVFGCDLKSKLQNSRYSNKIEYTSCNLEHLPYESNKFKFIASLSVIEHVVNLNKVLSEMIRVCQENGFIQISTDYWPEKIDCSGIYPYGPEAPEMKIFSTKEIEDLISYMENQGMSLVGPFNPQAYEKVCNWERVDRKYTFCRLLFKKDEKK